MRYVNNRVLAALENNKDLRKEEEILKINWADHQDIIRNYYNMMGMKVLQYTLNGEEDSYKEGENILHQEQCRSTLDVIDDPTAFIHDPGHGGKIRLQQYQFGHLAGCLGAGCHGDGAIRLLHGQHIVDAVAGHGHGMAGLLEGTDQFSLLIRCHPAEDGIMADGFRQHLIGGQRGCIHVPVGIGNACVNVLMTVFFPAGIALSVFTDARFYVFLGLFIAMLVLALKKVHPILIICISAVAGIIIGYIGI